MTLQEPIKFDDFNGGLIDDISVSDSLLPRNCVRKAINVIFDRPRGAISQRLGTTKLGGTVASGTISGLHNFRSSNSSYNQLLTSIGATIYRLNGSSWDSTVVMSTAATKTRFLTYLDAVAVLNGSDTPKSWTGTGAWLTTGGNLDIANFPVTKYGTILNSRVFAAGNSSNPDTVYKSSLEAAGAISWTSGNGSFKVFPNDGNGVITSLAGNGRVILIFKERGLYRYDDNELQRIVNIGTTSHESVVTDDNGITYFFGQGANTVGFYRTTGGFPSKISRPITKYIEAIAASGYQNISGFTDGTKVYWSVGSLTIDGITYPNSWLDYTIADQSWDVRNYQDSFRVFSQYINSSSEVTVVGGDTDGMIQTINSGYTDNGTAISAECEFGANAITSRGRYKVINEVMTYATHFQGLQFYLKADLGSYQTVGAIDFYSKKHSNFPKIRGYMIYAKITSINSGEPFQFDGYEFTNVTDEGYQ